MRKITKLFSNQAIKSIDEAKRIVEYIISTDDKDRMNEVVEQSWDLDNYKANPIVIWGHDPSNPDNVLGRAIEINTEKDGDRTITTAKVQFAEEGTSRGVDTVWSLVKQGILRTVSVGFIPHTFKDGDEDSGIAQVLADNELLEFSIVPIPANPQAVALAFGDESITEKDAKWLIKQYKQEQSFLEKAMYDNMKSNDNDTKQGAKAMSDEDVAKIAEAVGTAVADAVAPISEKLDKVLEAVDAEKPDEDEGDEPNPAPAGDENEDEPKKSAKSEQDDEDGAEDENEELDEEAEKAYLAELEKDFTKLEEEGKE